MGYSLLYQQLTGAGLGYQWKRLQGVRVRVNGLLFEETLVVPHAALLIALYKSDLAWSSIITVQSENLPRCDSRANIGK